jgi:hypothetical protein
MAAQTAAAAPPPAWARARQTVTSALRHPEGWARARLTEDSAKHTDLIDAGALLGVAAIGVAAYGLALHLPRGIEAGLLGAAAAAGGAGIAWVTTLPTLLIVGALLGSPLRPRAVLYAAMVTVSFAGLAMAASVPVLWFFSWAAPSLRILCVLASFLGVGLCMADVFLRVMGALERRRLLHVLWLGLLGVTGAEMFFVLGLFSGL